METALSKTRTALEYLLRVTPDYSGTYRITMKFRRGKVAHLSKRETPPAISDEIAEFQRTKDLHRI